MFVVSAATVLLVCACGEDETAGPDAGRPSPYSGDFELVYTPSVNTCAQLDPLDYLPEIERIEIRGETISFGSILGVWIVEQKSGEGTGGPVCEDLPDLDPACERCRYIDFGFVYANPDTFEGTVEIQFEHGVECASDDCYAVYVVRGVRR